MKVCEICGDEIATRDGDNICQDCDERQERGYQRLLQKQRRENNRLRDQVMRSLGLVKVRGACGGVYWE